MSTAPRAVIGVPLYEKASHLPAAVDSLLGQAGGAEFALVLVDDCSSDETSEVAARYAELDGRVHFRRNERRLGMIGNWRRCFELARELHPAAPYFAWGSDHDVWRPGWLEALVAELDAHAEAVAAYPQSIRISETGEQIRGPWSFDTAGEPRARRRLAAALRGMAAGSMVYALFRAEALERAGVFRYVLNPDKLLLSELALLGEFRQVPDVLWERRFTGLASRDRQRQAFFPDGAPVRTRLPIPIAHAAVLFAAHVIRGEGRPQIGRLRGLAAVLEYLRVSTVVYVGRQVARVRKRWARSRKAGRVGKKRRVRRP